ncbi:hypothetical protein Q3G72_031525 [Acer saccharum]|nr:hypothetical protein Q3G72_031525 [Acer saccharum]
MLTEASRRRDIGMNFEIRKLERKLENTLDSSNRIQRLLEKRKREMRIGDEARPGGPSPPRHDKGPSCADLSTARGVVACGAELLGTSHRATCLQGRS